MSYSYEAINNQNNNNKELRGLTLLVKSQGESHNTSSIKATRNLAHKPTFHKKRHTRSLRKNRTASLICLKAGKKTLACMPLDKAISDNKPATDKTAEASKVDNSKPLTSADIAKAGLTTYQAVLKEARVNNMGPKVARQLAQSAALAAMGVIAQSAGFKNPIPLAVKGTLKYIEGAGTATSLGNVAFSTVKTFNIVGKVIGPILTAYNTGKAINDIYSGKVHQADRNDVIMGQISEVTGTALSLFTYGIVSGSDLKTIYLTAFGSGPTAKMMQESIPNGIKEERRLNSLTIATNQTARLAEEHPCRQYVAAAEQARTDLDNLYTKLDTEGITAVAQLLFSHQQNQKAA